MSSEHAAFSPEGAAPFISFATVSLLRWRDGTSRRTSGH